MPPRIAKKAHQLSAQRLALEASESARALMVGVDVGGTKVRVLVADEMGEIVGTARELTAGNVVEQIARLVRDFAGPQCVGVGVGVPGVVDPRTGKISRVPNVPMLDGRGLRAELALALQVPVGVENDLIAAALAESVVADADEVLAVIGAGTGIGLGIVHGGAPLRGALGAAGEIAELPLSDGRELEEIVSVAGLGRAYEEFAGVRAEVSTILALAETGDAPASAAVREYARGLAHAVRVVRAVLDPSRIILTGGLGVAASVVEALSAELGRGPAGLALSEFGADLPAHGALVLARRAANEESADTLAEVPRSPSEARKRIRLPEQKNEILCRAAAYLSHSPAGGRRSGA